MKILILGGYGTFGGRLALLLANEPEVTLIVAGRSLSKAVALCNTLRGTAKKLAAVFDRNADIEQQLRQLTPDIVVDASGPFQDYGDDPYRVVKACLALGVDYLDLADGAGFVQGISQFDAVAKEKRVVVLSGVSSFPVLTAAVVRQLAAGVLEVKKITAGIAPSPFANVGLNVVRAIAGYAGKPLLLVRNGTSAKAYAFTEAQRYIIAPPGKLPLHSTLFSLVDVPDLRMLPPMWPQLDTIWTGAGPVPVVFHYMLIALAWLVRIRLLPTLAPLAPLFHKVINLLAWGEHRGGMFVEVEGPDATGELVKHSWHMVAEGDDGLFIPSMAAASLLQRILSGRLPAPGARAATNELELADYEIQFARRRIVTGRRTDTGLISHEPLYQRLLGNAWPDLPAPIREMHTLNGFKIVSGIADIERGHNFLARFVGGLFGFPAAGKEIPLTVNLSERKGAERWLRYFGSKKLATVQYEGKGQSRWLLNESLGPVTFGMALVLERGRLNYVTRRWSLLGVRLPLLLAPRSKTYEYVKDGCFWFDVEISHPLLGQIVRYHGYLKEQV